MKKTFGLKKRINFLTPVQVLMLSYVAVIFIGFLLLSLPQATVEEGAASPIDALFTSTSATCVTGLTVMSTAEDLTTFGQMVIYVQFQLGGLGVMVFSTLFALILGRKIRFRGRMLIKEDLQQNQMAGMVRLTRYVLLFSLIIQCTGMIAMTPFLLRDYSPLRAMYLSLFHTGSAFNNAGFDLFGDSLIRFAHHLPLNILFMVLIILGGLGFAVLVEIVCKQNHRRFSLNTRMVLTVTGALLLIGILGVGVLEWNGAATEQMGGTEKVLAFSFLSVTARTAGFNTVDTHLWSVPALFLVMALMFIGASPGSTGGGIKTTTLGVILASVRWRYRGSSDIEVFGRRLVIAVVLKAFVILFLAMSWVFIASWILLMVEDHEPIALLFESISAFGTVGLSMGVTDNLTAIGKGVLIMSMLMGRVGLMTMVLALGARTQSPHVRLPEGNVMVG